jgi:hypothetical protein
MQFHQKLSESSCRLLQWEQQGAFFLFICSLSITLGSQVTLFSGFSRITLSHVIGLQLVHSFGIVAVAELEQVDLNIKLAVTEPYKTSLKLEYIFGMQGQLRNLG